jgi:drug/metabolite transporter (DMT)-like permease
MTPAGPRNAAARAAPRLRTALQLGGIVLFWAANWPLIKLVLPDIGPLSFTALRFFGAALMMALLARMLRVPFVPARHERAMLAVTGLLQMGVMLGLAAVGLQYVPPGRAAVLVYTMSLWALPLGWWLANERPTPTQLIGGAVGLAGLLLFFEPAQILAGGRAAFGYGLILAAAVCWALGACLYRGRGGWRTPFWTQTLYQLLVSALAVGIAAAAFESARPIHWTWTLAAVLLFNWFVGTGLTYWWWGQVLAVLPAARAGQIASLVPVVALAMSALALGETVTLRLAVAVALVLGGVVIVSRGAAKRMSRAAGGAGKVR